MNASRTLSLGDWLRERPWSYSFIAAAIIWLATLGLSAGAGAILSLQTAMSFAVFFVIVGLGQMLVISTGPGNIDLSIPSVLTLSGYIGMIVMDNQSLMILPGLAVAAAIGISVGAVNFALIRSLSIPPIIATLATSFIVQSCAIYVGGDSLAKPPAAYSAFVAMRLFGVPVLPSLVVLVAVFAVFLFRKTLFGRAVLAVGQNERAAWLAGLEPQRIRFCVYVISGALAALAGVLLAGFSGGASLDMGSEYQLASIAVVVIGGTSVLGGRAFAQGIWGAALFLYLLVTLLNVMVVKFGLGTAGPGIRLILTGLIIVGIVALAGGED